MFMLEQKRTEGVLATPPPALTTTRKDRAMASEFPIPSGANAKGAQGELIASAWLLGLGYEVFRNVSASGPADLIAWEQDTGVTHFIDVKTVAYDAIYERSNGSLCIPLGRKGHGDVLRLLVVTGRVIGFCRGTENGVEFHWPLSCPEVPVDLTAPRYLDCGLRSRRVARGGR
jgi:hypothetical protein